MDAIQFKRIIEQGRKPTTSQLLEGELALNLAEQTIYTKDDKGNIIPIGRGGIPEYIIKYTSFTVAAKEAYQLDMSDGANKVVTIPAGLVNGDWFEVNLTKWNGAITGMTATLVFTTDKCTNGITDYDSLVIDSPCIIAMSKVDGKWIIAKAAGENSDVGALEQRIKKIENPDVLWVKGSVPASGGFLTLSAPVTEYKTIRFTFHTTSAGSTEIIEQDFSSDTLMESTSFNVGLYASDSYNARVVASMGDTTKVNLTNFYTVGWTGGGIAKVKGIK